MIISILLFIESRSMGTELNAFYNFLMRHLQPSLLPGAITVPTLQMRAGGLTEIKSLA